VTGGADREGNLPPPDARFWEMDTSHEAQVQRVFTSVENEFGRLDVLVNNAGISGVDPADPCMTPSVFPRAPFHGARCGRSSWARAVEAQISLLDRSRCRKCGWSCVPAGRAVSSVLMLVKFDARRLYRAHACASLFTYCAQVLHLSEHAA